MQAVVMNETGDADVLRYQEADRPEPGEGEVLIKVHAASVNPADWKYRRGFMEKPLPAVLGSDVSGTVVTSRADGFAEGDEVFGISASGGYAEYSTASAGVIARKPEGMSHEHGTRPPSDAWRQRRLGVTYTLAFGSVAARDGARLGVSNRRQ